MTNTITPKEKRAWREECKNWTGRDGDIVIRIRLLNALDAAEARAEKEAVSHKKTLVHCKFEFDRAEQAEAENERLRAALRDAAETMEWVLAGQPGWTFFIKYKGRVQDSLRSARQIVEKEQPHD